MYAIVLFSALLVISSKCVEGLNKFNQDILDTHNYLRAGHNVPPLKWSEELAGTAQKWVNELKRIYPKDPPSTGSSHSPADGYFREDNVGENYSWQSSSQLQPGSTHVLSWYSEIFDYNRENPEYSHFTQVVWKETTEIGCARATSEFEWQGMKMLSTHLTCQYYVAGKSGAVERYAEQVPKIKEGHFTQVVWKETTEIGCARATSEFEWQGMKMLSTHLTCQYYVAGNSGAVGRYAEQVPKIKEGSCKTTPGSCSSGSHCIAYGFNGQCSCPGYNALCEASEGCFASCERPQFKYDWTTECTGQTKCECSTDKGAICQ